MYKESILTEWVLKSTCLLNDNIVIHVS